MGPPRPHGLSAERRGRQHRCDDPWLPGLEHVGRDGAAFGLPPDLERDPGHLGRHLIDPDVDHAVPGLRPCRQGHLLDHQCRHDGPRVGGAQDRPARGQLQDHRVRGGARPVQRRRQGSDQRRGDRGPGDEAGRLDDAHHRYGPGPLRDRVQPERPLRRGDAPGFLGHSGGIYAGDRHLGRHLIDPDVDHAVPGLRPCRQGHLLDHQCRHDGPRVGGAQDRPARGQLQDHRVRGGARPVQRRRQGSDQRRGDRGPGDEAGRLDDAHHRYGPGPLRDRVQPERPLRRGDAPGFLGHSGGTLRR